MTEGRGGGRKEGYRVRINAPDSHDDGFRGVEAKSKSRKIGKCASGCSWGIPVQNIKSVGMFQYNIVSREEYSSAQWPVGRDVSAQTWRRDVGAYNCGGETVLPESDLVEVVPLPPPRLLKGCTLG